MIHPGAGRIVSIFFSLIVTAVVVGNIGEAIRVCTELGTGTHQVDGVTITCS